MAVKTGYELQLYNHYTGCRKGRHNHLKFINSKNAKGLHCVVGCNGEFHGIFITPNGGASFKQHNVKDLHNAVTMDKLAHEKIDSSNLSGCALILRAIKDLALGLSVVGPQKANPELSAVLLAIENVLASVARHRILLRKASNQVEPGRLDGILKQATEDIKKVIPLLKYRGATNPHIPYDVPEGKIKNGIEYIFLMDSNHLFTASATSELYEGKVQYRRDKKPTWARFTANLNLIWYMRIYRKGLAVINGNLVLDIVKTFPNGLLLLKVVRQGYGFTVNTVHAVYDPTRERLSWINKEDKIESFEEGKVPRRRRTKEELTKTTP